VPAALGNTTLCMFASARACRASSIDTANNGSGSTPFAGLGLGVVVTDQPAAFHADHLACDVVLTVFASKLTSDQRRPNTSETRHPVAANMVTTSTKSASAQ